MAMEQEPPAPPGATWGEYTLLRPLAHNCTSTDFLARTNREDSAEPYRLLKVVNAGLSAIPAFVTAFEATAARVAHLDHPNLMRMFEFGVQDREAFVAMAYVPGTSLRVIKERGFAEGGRLPMASVVGLALALSRALVRLERDDGGDRPLVHGGISLDTVVVSDAGQLKLRDFTIEAAIRTCVEDIRRAAGQDATLQEVLRPVPDDGRPQGLGHLSPERLLGRPIDARADQYALGALLFEMLHGRAPYARDDDAATVAAVVGGTLPDLRTDGDVPEALVATIERMLQRRPEHRFATVSEALDDLALLSGRLDVSSGLAWLKGLTAEALDRAQPSSAAPSPAASAPRGALAAASAASSGTGAATPLAPTPPAHPPPLPVVWITAAVVAVVLSITVGAWLLSG